MTIPAMIAKDVFYPKFQPSPKRTVGEVDKTVNDIVIGIVTMNNLMFHAATFTNKIEKAEDSVLVGGCVSLVIFDIFGF